MMNRRSLITGLISLVAAPAIVRAGSLMPVKAMLPEPEVVGWLVDLPLQNMAILGQSTFWFAGDGTLWELGTGIYKADDSLSDPPKPRLVKHRC